MRGVNADVDLSSILKIVVRCGDAWWVWWYGIVQVVWFGGVV